MLASQYGINQKLFLSRDLAKQESSVGKLARRNGISQEFPGTSRWESGEDSRRKLVRKHGIGGNSSVEDDAEEARRRL